MALDQFTAPDIRERLEYDTFSAVNYGNNTGRIGEFSRNAGTGWTEETILLFDIASILFSTITNVDLDITCNSQGSQSSSSAGLLHKQNKNSPSGWLGTNIDFDTPFAVSAWPTALQTIAAMLNTGTYTFSSNTALENEVQAWLDSNPANWGLIVAINFGAIGWWLSVDSVNLKVTHTPPTNTVWGGKCVGYDDFTGVSWCRLMGGNSPASVPGKTMRLRSVSVYVGSSHSEQVRVAVYQGGSLSNPSGASLKYDFGQTSGSATDQWLTLNHPGSGVDLDWNTPTWIAVKANGGGFTYHFTDDSGKSYDFQSARGRFNSTTMSTDETVAFESSISSGGSFSDFWYPFVLQYSEEDIVGGLPIMRRRRNLIHHL